MNSRYEISPQEREDNERRDRHEFSVEDLRQEDEREVIRGNPGEQETP